ncbi:MAG: hypothetical protein ABIM89_00855 [Mycobacteriales bacterium]
MKLPQLVRATVSRVIDLPGVKTAADRAPAVVIGTARKGAEIGLIGYGVARRTAAQLGGLVRSGISAGRDLFDQDEGQRRSTGPAQDPWSGGPLQPVDDIRETVGLSAQDAAEVDGLPDGDTLSHAALPLADYDHLTLGSLRGRIRTLSLGELLQVREYEHAHANRLPIVKMFDNRLASLTKDPATSDA